MATPQTTRLNRPWLLKMAIFTVALLAFGVYGLYDATVAYPARGERFASYKQHEMYERLARRGPLSREAVSIADPVAELTRLSGIAMPGEAEMARRDWLGALALIGRLRPEFTTTDNPDATYAELKQRWLTSSGQAAAQPKPLSWYDIPVQWIFTGIGFVGAAWMLMLWVLVARQKYRWEPETRTLTLPGGQSVSPSDLEDVDKRKWDKYLVFLKLKSPHPLAGRELKVDLYRYKPLESWVLAMEKQAFPDRGEDSDSLNPSPEGGPARAAETETAGA